MTPEQRVTAAIDCTPYAKATPDATATPTHDGRAWAAREEGSSWLDKM